MLREKLVGILPAYIIIYRLVIAPLKSEEFALKSGFQCLTSGKDINIGRRRIYYCIWMRTGLILNFMREIHNPNQFQPV